MQSFRHAEWSPRSALLWLLAAAAASAAGCSAKSFDHPGGEPDAAVEALLPPSLDPLPDRTPLDTVVARGLVSGVSGGARVVTSGSPSGELVTIVLPGGGFCQDVPLMPEGSTELAFYSMTGDGRVSDPVSAAVTHDPDAPQPSQGTCGETPECQDAEVCGTDGVDEDCNGWADETDYACNGCDDDAYEPNDIPVNVPSIPSGSYDLMICPGHDDWFAFHVQSGQKIHAYATFDTADMDLDMALFRSSPTGAGTDGTGPVWYQDETGATQTFDWTANAAGSYFLRIYPFDNGELPSGPYHLTVN